MTHPNATPDLHAETIDGQPAPTKEAIAALHEQLKPYVRNTPVFTRRDFPTLGDTQLTFKYELLQASGTFKARGRSRICWRSAMRNVRPV